MKRILRSPLVVTWSIVVAVLMAGLYAWYARPSRYADAVGVDWRATMRVAKCVGTMRARTCMAWRRAPPTAVTFTTLEFNPFTRGLVVISRHVVDSDSIAWATRVDSARRALLARQAPPLPCVSSLTGARIAEAWALGGREVRLSSAWTRTRPTASPFGGVTVALVPRGAFGCDRIWRIIWPTPEQAARAARLWVEDHLGF